jgi:AcrR family transcriptional regulator
MKSSRSENLPAPDKAALSAAERILDAAEAIFAHQGYYAATIRGITQAAGVPLNLARYHFGSKDQLFQRVIDRRAEETCRQLESSLEQALRQPGASPVEAVVETMVSLSIDRLASGDPGWRHYLQLLSHLGQLDDKPLLLQSWRTRYSRTRQRYFDALRQAMPQASETVIELGLHFLQTLVGHAMLDLAVTRYIGGAEMKAIDWEELRCHMVAHIVGGLQAQMRLAARWNCTT